jgi:uncharacterized cupin superfamily protein
MPKIDCEGVTPYRRSVYPGALRQRTSGYEKLKLSDAGGLTQWGLGEVVLQPGGATGLYHYHEREDEMVYCLEGEVTVIEGDETYTLGPGECAAFKAGVTVGHTVENRSSAPARFIEIGTRAGDEVAHYPGIDMKFVRGTHAPFQTRAGRQIADDETPGALNEPGAYDHINPTKDPIR